MQIVIDIPDKKYEALKMLESATIGLHLGVVEKAIINGTPLPKGHGELKDSDRVKAEVFKACMDEHFMPMKFLDCDTITEILDKAQTIIEADKEGAEE